MNTEKHKTVIELLERICFQRLVDIGLQLGNSGMFPAGEEPAPLSLENVKEIARCCGRDSLSGRLTFAAEDIFVRSRVEPVQAIFSQWMAGSLAQVNGEDIPFREIIAWCQECRDWEQRGRLAKEARSLCRFLAPLSHSTWQALTAAVVEELEYESYLAYCEVRRAISLSQEAEVCRHILDMHRQGYMDRVQKWLQSVYPGKRLSGATRFDAIYLLGMRYMDQVADGIISLETALEFFSGLGLEEKAGLRLHFEGRPGRQSYCVPVTIPGEVHVILGPVSGWLDYEALFHEMGHAFSFIHTSPELPVEAREFFVSGAVSETFAFLFQRLCMQENFLSMVMGAESDDLTDIEHVHELKLDILTRRYGAKFLIEYENFSADRISRGQELYAAVMERETGFVYEPETYLFDLMPDFYSLDYFQAFVASGILLEYLEGRFGEWWFVNDDALITLKTWAALGNRYDIHEFMEQVAGRDIALFP